MSPHLLRDALDIEIPFGPQYSPNMELVASRLLPDRFRRTEVYRDQVGEAPRYIKRYHGFELNKLESHFLWLKQHAFAITPRILGVERRETFLEVHMAACKGEPLWSLIDREGIRSVYQRAEGILAKLELYSTSLFANCPPGEGLIHKDFHMGNIFVSSEGFEFTDLEDLGMGHYSSMKVEISLNLLGDNALCPDKDADLFESLCAGLPLTETTYSEQFKEVSKYVSHFYDYYRERSNYFKKEQRLREILCQQVLQKDLHRA